CARDGTPQATSYFDYW
nr:immunoglobulin heavy chain junction region [Mus musculus]